MPSRSWLVWNPCYCNACCNTSAGWVRIGSPLCACACRQHAATPGRSRNLHSKRRKHQWPQNLPGLSMHTTGPRRCCGGGKRPTGSDRCQHAPAVSSVWALWAGGPMSDQVVSTWWLPCADLRPLAVLLTSHVLAQYAVRSSVRVSTESSVVLSAHWHCTELPQAQALGRTCGHPSRLMWTLDCAVTKLGRSVLKVSSGHQIASLRGSQTVLTRSCRTHERSQR